MRVLLATESVHTTARGCDYLQGRLGPDDEVLVLAVAEPGLAARDPGDATNVARARLVGPAVETLQETGDPAAVVERVADERGVDELVIGLRGGEPAEGDETRTPGPGSTARALLADPDRPVVVLPAAAP